MRYCLFTGFTNMKIVSKVRFQNVVKQENCFFVFSCLFLESFDIYYKQFELQISTKELVSEMASNETPTSIPLSIAAKCGELTQKTKNVNEQLIRSVSGFWFLVSGFCLQMKKWIIWFRWSMMRGIVKF